MLSTSQHDTQHDISFRQAAAGIYPPSQAPENVHGRYPYAKTPKRRLLRQTDDLYYDTWGVTNANPKTSLHIYTLSLHLQRWLADSDSDDEEDGYPPPTINQDTVSNDIGHEYPTLRRCRDTSTESRYVSQASRGSFATMQPMNPDDLLGEVAKSFASKYLNLDYEISAFSNQTVKAEAGFPSTSSDSSASTTSTIRDEEMRWEVEPTSLSLLDTTKFGNETDANGDDTRNLWPWGDYTYRPPSPQRYLDPEEYAREYQLMKIEEKLRDRLMERFAEDAIQAGKKAKVEKRRETGKGKEVDTEPPTHIIAFSQVIRGRTIYNP